MLSDSRKEIRRIWETLIKMKLSCMYVTNLPLQCTANVANRPTLIGISVMQLPKCSYERKWSDGTWIIKTMLANL